MTDMNLIFQYTGMITLGAAAFSVAFSLLVYLAVWIWVYFPRVHFGKMKHEGYLSFIQNFKITTYKKGGKREITEKPEVFQKFPIKRMFGFSSRQKPKWLFGLIVFEGVNRAYDF